MPTLTESQFGPLRDDIVACKLKIAVLETGQKSIKEELERVDEDVTAMKIDLVKHTTRSNIINAVVIIVATAIIQIIVNNIFKQGNQPYVQDRQDHGQAASGRTDR